jgi:hypothetical protein
MKGREVIRSTDYVKTWSGTDVDDGWKQIGTKEVGPRAELRQASDQNQRKLQRAVLELCICGLVAYAVVNCRY